MGIPSWSQALRMDGLKAFALSLAWLAGLAPLVAHAAPKTVCTITVNSDDEREVLRRNLPPGEYDFVELVDRGRADWLASSCSKGVRCDVLVISGHFDGGTEFYTDRLDVREYLAVDELERASCSESCPGLFAHLKEVYLFGCNTLNAEPMRSASPEIARSLVRAGYTPADAERTSRTLAERHGESNRDRMRHIFKDVPLIYGFSGKAPLGRYAGPTFERYLKSTGGAEFGTGRPSATLLGLFAPTGMTVTPGLKDTDPKAGFRRDACHFSDERLTVASKVDFVHELLGREMAEVRMFLDPIERFAGSVPAAGRQSPETARSLDAIAGDKAARERYLTFARDADDPAVRVRMMAVARSLGWLTVDEERSEYAQMVADRMARDAVGVADVELRLRARPQARDGSGTAGAPAARGPGGQRRRCRGARLPRQPGRACARAACARRHERRRRPDRAGLPAPPPDRRRERDSRRDGRHRSHAGVRGAGPRARHARGPSPERSGQPDDPCQPVSEDPVAAGPAGDRGHPDSRRLPAARRHRPGEDAAHAPREVAGRQGSDRRADPPAPVHVTRTAIGRPASS
jgi:hypothetical protein